MAHHWKNTVWVTLWIVFHFKSRCCCRPVRMKMNKDLIAWRDLAWRNWRTTILSHHGWCNWTTVINGQKIKPKEIGLFVVLIWQLQRIGTYPQLECASTSKDRKLISTVCPICAWISQFMSRFRSYPGNPGDVMTPLPRQLHSEQESVLTFTQQSLPS